MVRKKTELSAPEYAILGLLCRQPMHGYEVARYLTSDEGLGLICPLGLSNVYFLLGNLERAGFVEVDRRDEGAYPPRTVLRATVAGKRAFRAWMRQPVGRLRHVRLDFLLKLYFLWGQGAGSMLDLLEKQIEFCERYLSEWRERADAAGPQSFERLAVESKITAAQGTLDWLLGYREDLREGGRPLEVPAPPGGDV
jgi:PadR family transcriptional regulator AphA